MAGADWAAEVNIKLNKMKADESSREMKDWTKQSIYKLPTCITNLNEKAFIPQVVSFGPYHHRKDHLLPMEEHKERALLHFLNRSNIPLQALIHSLAQVVKDLKSSYATLPKEWQEDDEKFIRLMILDGCFMLGILILEDFGDCDPIFSMHGRINMWTFMKRDMLMLENQLPMLVLERLLDWDDEHLNELILKFFTPCALVLPVVGKCLHILDVYRKSLLQGPQYEGGGTGNFFLATIPAATELYEVGIRFQKSKTTSLEDISFNGGTLKLPLIVVDDSTESMFLNVIAFERYHAGAGNQVTSYLFFMDDIINNEKDVALLKSTGIIENWLESEQEVARLFNSLCKEVTVNLDMKVSEIRGDVRVYCNKPWNLWKANFKSWKANLIHTYFRSPWALISLIAAILLFVIATLQTVYTVYPYYKNNSPRPPPPLVP